MLRSPPDGGLCLTVSHYIYLVIMLRIREEQLSVFRQAAFRRFEDSLVPHLRKFAPELSEALGEERLRDVIRLGIERSGKYGFNQRGSVRLYVELMFLFGSDYDTDPQYPWAGAVLTNPAYVDPMERAERLYDEMESYLDAVAGPDDEYSHRALRAMSGLPPDLTLLREARFEEQILALMKSIFPEKCRYVGKHSLCALITRAVEEAEAFSLATQEGKILFVGMMFALGHGFACDRLYPWVAYTLNNPSIKNPHKRIERLRSKGLTYLGQVLSNIKEG